MTFYLQYCIFSLSLHANTVPCTRHVMKYYRLLLTSLILLRAFPLLLTGYFVDWWSQRRTRLKLGQNDFDWKFKIGDSEELSGILSVVTASLQENMIALVEEWWLQASVHIHGGLSINDANAEVWKEYKHYYVLWLWLSFWLIIVQFLRFYQHYKWSLEVLNGLRW